MVAAIAGIVGERPTAADPWKRTGLLKVGQGPSVAAGIATAEVAIVAIASSWKPFGLTAIEEATDCSTSFLQTSLIAIMEATDIAD